MNKWPIGTRVKIKDDLKVGEYYGGEVYTTYMAPYAGLEFKIADYVYSEDEEFRGYILDEDENGRVWTREMFIPFSTADIILENFIKFVDTQINMIHHVKEEFNEEDPGSYEALIKLFEKIREVLDE